MNLYKHLRKRGLALFLSLVLCLSLVTPAFAADLKDLQDAVNGENDTEENQFTADDGSTRYGYGERYEDKKWGIEAWTYGDTRNVQLNEDVTYNESNDGQDAAPDEGMAANADDSNPAGEGEAASDITTVVIDSGKNVSLNLNGNNVTGDGEHDVISVEKDASLTVKGSEAETPAGETKNTIEGDVYNDGALTTKDDVTIKGNVKNNGHFTLEDNSFVTETVYNSSKSTFGGNSSKKGEVKTETLLSGGTWHLESVKDSTGYRLVVSSGRSEGSNDESWVAAQGIDPLTITEVEIKDGVTSIGSYAFKDCTGLTKVTIPSSVKYIYDAAFRNCTSLESVTISDGVTYIGSNAFQNCTSLKVVDIPGNVKDISFAAFQDCTGLESVTFADGVTKIGINAFMNCTSLTEVKIPSSVTCVRNNVFRGCTSLASVEIPDSVTSIETAAFSGCSSLTSVTIPNGVTEIATQVFRDCTSLTSVTIPDSVTSIGQGAFNGCSSLPEVKIPEGVTSIGEWAFASCKRLTSVEIPDGVTEIADCAFRYCSKLTSVTIPDDVTSIGANAFERCSKLTSVTIPADVTSIGDNAFKECTGLTSVTIPDGVTEIGANAFYSCRPEYVVHTDKDGNPTAVTYYPNKAAGFDYGDTKDFYGNKNNPSVTQNAADGTVTVVAKTDYTVTASEDGKQPEIVKNEDGSITITVPKGGKVDDKVSSGCDTLTVGKTGSVSPAKNHTEADDEGKAATCTEAGHEAGTKCSVCGDTLSGMETIPANGHAEETVKGKPATCTEDGLTDGAKCSVCGEVLTKQEPITTKGHTSGEAVRENEVPAAAGKEGSYDEVVYCSECGEEISRESKTIDALPVEQPETPETPDAPGVTIPDFDIPMAGDLGDGADFDATVTITDGETPLVGLLALADLLEALRQHEGIEEIELPEDFKWAGHEYAQAIYWGLQEQLVADTEEQPFDPDEIITVAILRDVLTNFVEIYKKLDDFTITVEGEDDDIVMDLGERLTAFYGELDAHLKAQEA